MGDSLPRTQMNHRTKFDAASFVLGGEIRNRTNTQKNTETVTDISTPCLSACVDNYSVCRSRQQHVRVSLTDWRQLVPTWRRQQRIQRHHGRVHFCMNLSSYDLCCLFLSAELLVAARDLGCHSDEDHRIPFVGGPNTRITNPTWWTAAILEKSKNRSP